MSSLEACIRKAGKALSPADGNAIRVLRDDIFGAGDISRSDANVEAVAEYIEILAEERIEIVKRIEEQGGVAIPITLSNMAREYPQIGLQRASRDKSADLRSKRMPELLDILKYFDKQMADTLWEANKHINSRDDLNDFRELLIEHIEPFMAKPMKFAAGDIFEEDFSNAYPDHPIAHVSKMGEALQKAADEPVPKGTFREWVRGLVEKYGTVTSILRGVPQTKLPDFIRFGMESVREYVNTMNVMNGFMNSMLEGHAELANDWLQFKKKNEKQTQILGEFMHGSSLAGVDPMNERVPTQTELTKMNKAARQVWTDRLRDRKILMKFWNNQLAKGERAKYQKKVYNTKTEKLENAGPPIELSAAQVIYLRVRDSYSNQRKRLIQGLEDRINASEASQQSKASLIAYLRTQFEAGEIKPYFPFSRFGKYWATIKIPGTGEVISFNKFIHRGDRNAFIKEMRSKGFMAFTAEEEVTDAETAEGIDPTFVAQVTALVGDQKKSGKELQDEIWQMYLQMLPEMSVRKHVIHRKGTLGFTTDALQSFGDVMFHGTHQLGKLKYGHILSGYIRDAHEDASELEGKESLIEEMEQHGFREPGKKDLSLHEAMLARFADYKPLYEKYKKAGNKDAQKDAREKIKAEAKHDAPWAHPLADEIGRRHGYNMNPKSAAWATKLTAYGFLWFLSTSPAAGILNLSQTAIVAYPALRAKYNGAGAGMALWKAMAEYTGTGNVEKMIVKLKNDEGSPEGDNATGEKAAMIWFDIIGMFTKTRSRDMQGFSESGLHFKTGQARMMEMAGWIFHKTEEANRVATGLATYRLARKSTFGAEKLTGDKYISVKEQHEQAMKIAEKLVEMSHFDYTNTNRPPLMQGDTTRVIFLFRNFSLNMTYRLARDFKDGIWKNPDIPQDVRREARQRFGGMLAMAGMFSGLSGIPLAAATHAILSAVLGDKDDPFDSEDAMRAWMVEAWGEEVAEIIHKGPWDAFTGSTLSARASLNNLWIREIPESVRGRELLPHLAGEILGPIFGIGMNFAQGFSNLAEGHTRRGIERFVPKAVADVMKTIRFAQQGAQTYSKDLIMTPEEFTTHRLIVQALGFTPSELTLQYEQNRALKDASMRLKRRHSNLMNSLFNAYKVQDRAGARSALKEIMQWNKANPRFPISPQTLMSSAKARARYDQRTVGGVALDKRLEYLREKYRFIDKDKRR